METPEYTGFQSSLFCGIRKKYVGEDFLGSLMVKNLPSSAAYMDGFDPCPGKSPHSGEQISL